MEAFNFVIAPAYSIKEKLPVSESGFVRAIGRLLGKSPAEKISRKEAREFSVRLNARYSPSVAAKALIYIHQKKFSGKFAIISGIRGWRNSLHFKKNGYLVVYLSAPEKLLAKRLSERDGINIKEAENEILDEENIFSTKKEEGVAFLSFETLGDRSKKIAARIAEAVGEETHV